MYVDPKLSHLNRKLIVIPEPQTEPKCFCLEYPGDNRDCPEHGYLYREYERRDEEGSDNTMKASLEDAGFGQDGRF